MCHKATRRVLDGCRCLRLESSSIRLCSKKKWFSIYETDLGSQKNPSKCVTRDELINYKINGCIFVWIEEGVAWKRRFYKSSSSSGRAVSWAAMYSSSCFFCHWGSIWTSGGSKAGMATNSRLGSPISLRANQRKGFSKL